MSLREYSLEIFLGVFFLIGAVLIGFLIFLSIKESNACEARGGQMVGTGEYYSTVVMVGKVPVAQMHEHVACTVAE